MKKWTQARRKAHGEKIRAAIASRSSTYRLAGNEEPYVEGGAIDYDMPPPEIDHTIESVVVLIQYKDGTATAKRVI